MMTPSTQQSTPRCCAGSPNSEPPDAVPAQTRSRECPASPQCTQLPRPPPAPTSTQTEPSPGPVTGKAPGKQASLPRKEVGVQPRRGRRGRGRLGAGGGGGPPRADSEGRGPAQGRSTGTHCVSAPRPGARGWARPPRPPQGPCPPGTCRSDQGWGSCASSRPGAQSP